MSQTKTTIPTLNNWGEITSKNFYKGVEVRKANKSTAVPKTGTTPMFYYVNKQGATGNWYNVKDLTVVSQEDKELLKSLKSQRDDLFKEYKQGNITLTAFNKVAQEVEETIAKLSK